MNTAGFFLSAVFFLLVMNAAVIVAVVLKYTSEFIYKAADKKECGGVDKKMA